MFLGLQGQEYNYEGTGLFLCYGDTMRTLWGEGVFTVTAGPCWGGVVREEGPPLKF